MVDPSYLNLGYSTPFLSPDASYMHSLLAVAVIYVDEEITIMGLPLGICLLVFVFIGS